MRYKLLGRSGLWVSEMALGTMTFGEDWGWGAGKEVSRQLFDLYAEAGGNFIDTAVNYTNGTSESYIGDFIAADRSHFVVATKYSLSRRPADPNAGGNARKNMIESVNTSLRRLKTDYIDLYWVHIWDQVTPIEEVMRALDDLVRAGKVLYIGISDTPAWVIARANMLADLRGWSPFTAVQLRYSLADRAVERDLLPMARALDLAVTPWSILGAGVLTGKYNSGPATTGRAATWQEIPAHHKRVAETVVTVAQEMGCTPSQVAISWVRQQPGTIIPLVGATKPEQLRDNLAALDVTLSPENMARLSAANPVDLGFPHDFLQADYVQKLIFGDAAAQLERRR